MSDDRSAVSDGRSAVSDDRSVMSDDRSAVSDDLSDDRSVESDDRSAVSGDRSVVSDDRSAEGSVLTRCWCWGVRLSRCPRVYAAPRSKLLLDFGGDGRQLAGDAVGNVAEVRVVRAEPAALGFRRDRPEKAFQVAEVGHDGAQLGPREPFGVVRPVPQELQDEVMEHDAEPAQGVVDGLVGEEE